MENLVFSKSGSHFIYGRSSSIEQDSLKKILKTKYATTEGEGECCITSSGMSAISTLMHTFCSNQTYKKITILYSNELYTDTPRLFESLQDVYPDRIHLEPFDIMTKKTIKSNLNLVDFCTTLTDENSIYILFVESCSNPNSYMFDFNVVKELRKLNLLLHVVVDNTWLSSTISIHFNLVPITLSFL